MTETQVQNAICEYLTVKKHFFWRQNVMGRYNSSRDVHYRMPKYSMVGIPDIILIKNGLFIGLEVKTEKGKISPNQAEFEELCNKAGGEYHIVRSIDDVVALGL